MLYQAPDYERIRFTVSDLFAAYPAGCGMDEGEASNQNDYCEYNTFTDLGWAHGCYSTSNA